MQLDKQKKREYCEILGVPESTCDDDTIKRAYKRLALEHHPDRPSNKGREEESGTKFRKITEAYEKLQANNNAMSMLKNVFKSQEIHSSLEHFLFTTGTSVNFNFNSMSSSCSTDSKNNSGTFSSRIFAKKGQSLRTTLKIRFDECLYGCSKIIEFTRTLVCIGCGGVKAATPAVCRDCGGKGVLKAVINGGPYGGSSVTTACPTCSSSSSTINRTQSQDLGGSGCINCHGTGKITERKTCTVEVPPGVITGMQKIFEGEGDESEDGGNPGDLIVCFEVESHPFYQRKGDDVYCNVPVQFPQACLGTVIDFPSLYNKKIEVVIRPGIVHNEIIKFEQEGFVNPEKQRRGDLYIQIVLVMPKIVTEEEKQLLYKLATMPNFMPIFKDKDSAPSSPATSK
eukprot:TRINITY_DN1282_c0_g1_i1.p1 TRINITY_DN1282_c0_g1~~TRINITY_DN1282_c0_g1_i1.p1  ORF type:complete len:398 (-),score=121.34 TRINITY_DN1282_c0_g1_i1:126-1319(-)